MAKVLSFVCFAKKNKYEISNTNLDEAKQLKLTRNMKY